MTEATLNQLAFNPAQAAGVLNISVNAVRTAIADGELIYRKCGCHWRILRSDLIAWSKTWPIVRGAASDE